MNKRILFLVMILLAVGMSSCGIFRKKKKKKCPTCPKWSVQMHVDTEQSIAFG